MKRSGPGAPSEAQLDLAEGVRHRAEGETTPDLGAQVLDRLARQCREEPAGARPVKTVREVCALPADVLAAYRKGAEPYPDPHEWAPAPGALGAEWLRCVKCQEWMRRSEPAAAAERRRVAALQKEERRWNRRRG